jgi:hypothetical protein
MTKYDVHNTVRDGARFDWTLGVKHAWLLWNVHRISQISVLIQLKAIWLTMQ